ncbi:MAG: flagellar biosynthetic protein FliR [Rhodocyclaceae bacterium]|nr:flagellar biosynthetic protein FliR [Rhodocyclaceae bacterium]
MIVVTSSQLESWIAAFLFPLVRVLALIAAAPVFNNRAIPVRIRLGLGVVIAFALAPALPVSPGIPAGSWLGFVLIAREILIGLLLGFAVRLAFAAVDLAGEVIGMQMSLSFATFYDPQNAAATPVLAEFLGLLATLVYLSLNGHLLMLSVLAESYRWWPIALQALAPAGFSQLFAWSASLFAAGLLLALPLIAALLIANLAMGVLARVAPQLNIFAVGFPVTLVVGFVMLMFVLPLFGAALEELFSAAFASLAVLQRAAAPSP